MECPIRIRRGPECKIDVGPRWICSRHPPWLPGNRVTSARKDSPEKYREPDLSQPGSSYEKGTGRQSGFPFVIAMVPKAGFLLLPLYVGIGRVKNQAHWQTDVLAGWAVGGLSGWFTHSRETPLIVQVLPHGVVVGLKTRF